MGLPGPNDVGEAKRGALQLEQVTVSAERRFACQLACPVSGDWLQRAVDLAYRCGARIAVDPAAGGVQDPPDSGYAHRLEDILGQIGSFPEVNVRLLGRSSDVRIRGK